MFSLNYINNIVHSLKKKLLQDGKQEYIDIESIVCEGEKPICDENYHINSVQYNYSRNNYDSIV
jgi:hypothetical protein